MVCSCTCYGYSVGNPDLWYTRANPSPVKINVEAYVVKGMSTALILGNDFVDQYTLFYF